MTTANRWADPTGYEAEPPRVRYRIRDASGAVVEHATSVAYDSKRKRYFHSLAAFDQPFADGIVDIIQAACAYFHAAEGEYEPIEGVEEIRLTDDEISERIARLEQGENVREAERTSLEYYPIADLPFDQQRALIERIEQHKQRWRFEIIGEEAPAAAAA
jgi:hypothetical protein